MVLTARSSGLSPATGAWVGGQSAALPTVITRIVPNTDMVMITFRKGVAIVIDAWFARQPGLSETEASNRRIDIQVSRFPWAASGRATTMGKPQGVTKLVIEPGTERVLGVGIVGPGAGEMIAEGTLAIEMGAVASDLKLTIHAHPTLSETVMESAEAFFGHATHIHRPKRK